MLLIDSGCTLTTPAIDSVGGNWNHLKPTASTFKNSSQSAKADMGQLLKSTQTQMHGRAYLDPNRIVLKLVT